MPITQTVCDCCRGLHRPDVFRSFRQAAVS